MLSAGEICQLYFHRFFLSIHSVKLWCTLYYRYGDTDESLHREVFFRNPIWAKLRRETYILIFLQMVPYTFLYDYQSLSWKWILKKKKKKRKKKNTVERDLSNSFLEILIPVKLKVITSSMLMASYDLYNCEADFFERNIPICQKLIVQDHFIFETW